MRRRTSLLAALAPASAFQASGSGIAADGLGENPSCWTDGYTWDRCCRSDAVATDECFALDDLAAPWSRARCCASPCGAPLEARFRAGGFCAGVAQSNVTLVTGLWNLGRQHWAPHIRYSEGAERSYDKYLSWLDKLLSKPQALVLFLDKEAYSFAAERRKARGLEHLTCLVEVPFEQLPQMQWRSAYQNAHDRNRRELPDDSQPEVLHADYTIAVNSKPELLACAAHWDPFRSTSFAWLDAGAGRKKSFPAGTAPVVLPECRPWALCVGRRMWLFFDFKSKLLRLKHGSTFDTTVLLGGREGVLFYALWFQWAVSRYLDEGIMDDEQSIIAEVWWDGNFDIQSFYGMGWDEALAQMVRASDLGAALDAEELASLEMANGMGRWWGRHPSLVHSNTGDLWIPFAGNLMVVKPTQVNQVTDEELERVAYAMWCLNKKYGYYRQFCEAYNKEQQEVELSELPILTRGNILVPASQD